MTIYLPTLVSKNDFNLWKYALENFNRESCEDICYYAPRFNHLLNKIRRFSPQDMRPSDSTAMDYYIKGLRDIPNGFDFRTRVLDKNPGTLEEAISFSKIVEANYQR